MCKTSTHLIYGIVVKTWSLYIAALAHSELVEPVLALDLIMMRFRIGTLQREEGKKILPLEIWEMIKVELYEIEVVEAEKQELVGHDLYPEIDVRTESGGSTIYTPRFFALGPEHEGHFEATLDNLRKNMRYDPSARYSTFPTEFLAAISLYNTPAEGYLNIFGNDGHADVNQLVSAVSIRFPFSSSTSSINALESEVDHEMGRSATAAFISPHIFTKSYDPLRFKRLVKYYRLDLADVDLPHLKCKRFTAKGGKESGEGGEQVKEEKKILRVEPKWMLWSGTFDC